MNDPLVELIVRYLLELTHAGGAGVLAWWLFRQARAAFPPPATKPARRIVAFAYTWLYRDDRAYLSVAALAGVIAFLSSYAIALLTGGDMLWNSWLALAVATYQHHRTKLSAP